MFSEQKIADGIYLSKPNTSLNTNSNINILLNSQFDKKTVVKTEYNEKVLANSNGEMIAIYENDFYLLEFEVKSLFEANEEMLRFNPNDYDLIEARQENLFFINKKLSRMKEIQVELRTLCPSNPICQIDIFEYFSQKNEANEEVCSNTKEKSKEEEKVTKITEEIDL